MAASRARQSHRWPRVVGLVPAVLLAALLLTAWLWGAAGADSGPAGPVTRYVHGATGSNTANDCASRARPCATIGHALGQAEDGDTVLVAWGTYTENLVITKTVTLLGAYEPVRWSRCLRSWETVIDGNQRGRVIDVRSTLSDTTVIDGFMITNGDGGMSILLSSVTIRNCRIVRNRTTGTRSGGGMVIDHSFVGVTNTVVADNTANHHDGAMLIKSSTHITGPYGVVSINASTIASNTASNGRNGIFCSLSRCDVVNSILWGHRGEDLGGHNYDAAYSDIEMCCPPNGDPICESEGITCTDPGFVDPSRGDYHLESTSLCIDAGTNDQAPETDFEGDPRPFDGDGDGLAVADMGADESLPAAPTKVWLPHLVRHWCSPAVTFIRVPTYGSFDDLLGQVACVEPDDYAVAVYTYVSGWWNKPTWADPLTVIRADGSWTCDVTTGEGDELATEIAAFVVPTGYDPPMMAGGQRLPADLLETAVARVMVEREPVFREVAFSGYTWRVKASETPVGPGPNPFSDRVEDVWVDQDDRLHLRIVPRDGDWYCTEVVTEAPLGYGDYVFQLARREEQLDRNVVLGLFTWDDTAPDHHYREIDIEVARWGDAGNENAQYVVQPYYHSGNMYRFDLELQGQDTTHGFAWREDSIIFQSLHGHRPFPGSPVEEIASWIYTGDDVPPAGEGNARINLWLFEGKPPSGGEAVEVIIEAFDFLPYTSAAKR